MADGTNTYAVRGTVNDTQHNATRTLIDCLAPTPGTYTLTLSGATTQSFVVFVYTGLASFSVGSFKSFFAVNPATTADGAATAAVTPTAYPAAVVSLMGTTGGAPSISFGTGFTGRLNSSWAFGNGCLGEDLRLLAGSNIASYTANVINACTAIVAGAYLEPAIPAVLGAPYSLESAEYF